MKKIPPLFSIRVRNKAIKATVGNKINQTKGITNKRIQLK